MRRALVLGGTGAIGGAVVRELRARGVEVRFTFFASADRARSLATEVDAPAHALDVRDGAAMKALATELAATNCAPDVLVYAVGSLETTPLLELDDAALEESLAVNARGAIRAVRAFAPHLPAAGGDVVLLGGLDRAQSLPVPVAYASAQGLLAGFTMAAAKELGPLRVRINMVALGLTTDGLSLALGSKLREDYAAFSALRRFGTPAEAARAIAWLALENTFITGKVVPVNGGL